MFLILIYTKIVTPTKRINLALGSLLVYLGALVHGGPEMPGCNSSLVLNSCPIND